MEVEADLEIIFSTIAPLLSCAPPARPPLAVCCSSLGSFLDANDVVLAVVLAAALHLDSVALATAHLLQPPSFLRLGASSSPLPALVSAIPTGLARATT